jgi:hypothetical protein
MTHDELLAKVNKELELAIFEDACGDGNNPAVPRALRAVVELHHEHTSGSGDIYCYNCQQKYPCLTIQAIEKELQ